MLGFPVQALGPQSCLNVPLPSRKTRKAQASAFRVSFWRSLEAGKASQVAALLPLALAPPYPMLANSYSGIRAQGSQAPALRNQAPHETNPHILTSNTHTARSRTDSLDSATKCLHERLSAEASTTSHTGTGHRQPRL